MALMAVPETGLELYHSQIDPQSSKNASQYAQVMQLDLDDAVFRDIIKTCRHGGGKTLHISFGKSIALHYGSKSRYMSAIPSCSHTQLYDQPQEATKSLTFAGTISHTLAMQKAREETAGADEALTKLQNSLASAEKTKQSHQIKYIPNNTSLPRPVKQTAATIKPKPSKPNALSFLRNKSNSGYSNHTTTRSMPTSPAIGAVTMSSTQIAASTSNSSMITNPLKSQAIRFALIHLLAIRAVSAKFIAQKLTCTENDVLPVLRKVGKQLRHDETKWDLNDKIFKDLKVWEFEYSNSDERQDAIERAVSAFDRMRLSQEDQVWQMLYPKSDRGKGKTLSNLHHLHKGPIQQSNTPRIHVQHPEDSTQEGTAEQESGLRGRLGPTSAEPMARSRSHESVRKTKISEKEAQSKRLLSKGPKKVASSPKEKGKEQDIHPAVRKGTKNLSAPKSSEFVNDSDEEDGLDEAIALSGRPATLNSSQLSSQSKKPAGSTPSPAPVAKETDPKSAKTAVPPQSKTSTPASSRNKLKVNNSSLPSHASETTRSKPTGAGNGRAKDTNSAQEAHPPTATSEQKQMTNGLHKSPQSSTGMKKTLSRQRNGSSPHKPSPLGSSPPTNASDLDNATHSSSSSTPPILQASKQPATPNGISQPSNGHARHAHKHSLKRKAADLDKDIHLYSSSLANGDVDGLATGRIESKPTKRQKTSEPTPPSSDSSSPPSGYDAVNEATKFKDVLYPKYQEFYIQVQELGKDATEEQLEKLMRMHKRLEEVKKEITEAFQVRRCE